MGDPFTVRMWDYLVSIEVQLLSGTADEIWGEVDILLPSQLHQQLQGKPLKLIAKGHPAQELTEDGFDRETGRIRHVARFTLQPGENMALMSHQLQMTFVQWKAEPGDLTCVWKTDK